MTIKILSVRFFLTRSGNEPVREWIKSLTLEEKKNIGQDIKTIQIGWPIGMPLVRSIGDGLYEIRSSLPSNKISRIIFFIYEKQIILLHGFIKKTQKTDINDINLAKKRKSEVINYDQKSN